MPDEAVQNDSMKQGKFSSYDVFILIITMLSLIVMALHFIPYTNQRDTDIAFMLDSLFGLIFLYDFFRRFIKADNRKQYFFKHGGWLDLIGSFPRFPILRLLRIWRLWRIMLKMRGMTLREIWRRYWSDKVEGVFWSTALVTILVLTLSSFLIVRLESPAPDAQITTPSDALYWAVVTISTVGYGDLVPVTPDGRLLAGLLITVGIALVSVLTSFATTRLITYNDPENQKEPDEMLNGIRGINKRLDRIEMMLKDVGVEDQDIE
jgi:voltage-gated potassium channel